jgi:hypothetical protein
VVVEDAESLHLTGPLTMAFWVYPEKQTREVGRIVFKAAGGEFGVELKQDGTLMFGHGSTGAVQQPGQQVNCSKKLPHEVWTHVCIVRDPGSKSIVWYINGREVERVALTVNPAASTGRPLILGGGRKRNPSEGLQPPDAFQGILDELVMLKTVLSGKEIAWLYQEVGGTQ